MEKSYCEPYIKTNWTSPEEAFGACSATSSCAAFWADCKNSYEYGRKYYYCASIETIGSYGYCSHAMSKRKRPSYTLFIKPGKSHLERQHFLNLKFFILGFQ